MLLLLFVLLIVGGSTLGMVFGTVEVVGLSFTLGIFCSTPLMFLRDYLQEKGYGWKPFLISLPAYVAIYFIATYFVDDPAMRAGAVTIAAMWTFLIDRNVYLYFRRFGWGPAMVLSDIVSVPMITIMFFYVYFGGWSVPDGQLLVKYLTMAVGYAILFHTRLIDDKIAIPRVINVPRERWFKYYDY